MSTESLTLISLSVSLRHLCLQSLSPFLARLYPPDLSQLLLGFCVDGNEGLIDDSKAYIRL
jgi:hypothetical protein